MRNTVICTALAVFLCLIPLGAGAHAQESTTDPLDIPQGGGLPPAPPAVSSDLLAAGNPPLTRSIADNYAGFVMWLLDAPFTESQHQDLQDALVSSWQANDQTTIGTAVQMSADYAQLAQLTDTQRVQLRSQLQPQFLNQAQHASDTYSRWLLNVYNAAHQPIAQGNPPLTRQMSDANVEVTYFVLQVVATGDATIDGLQLQHTDFDSWATGLASAYPSHTQDQQQMMARMPIFRAAMAEGWKQFTDDQKQQYRTAWRPIAEQWLANVPDSTFDTLWEASLVEHTDANGQRYANAAGVNHISGMSDGSQGKLVGNQAAYAHAMAQLHNSHSAYMMLSGGLMDSWAGNMNAINNFGDSPYTYVMK